MSYFVAYDAANRCIKYAFTGLSVSCNVIYTATESIANIENEQLCYEIAPT